jgi:DNA-binding NarL/FixJ family response regulator
MSNLNDRTAVLLDRHPLWLEAVERVLMSIGVEVVGKTTSPTEALTLLEGREPDLFITDIGMPDGAMDGLTCLAHARERRPSLRVIVLSGHADAQHVDAALAAGAVAYVVKTAQADDLASAVRQTFDHSLYLARRSGNGEPGSGDSKPVVDSRGLTRRELEILRLVAEGYSNAQLATMLWVTEQTVKFHLSNVYRKLQVSNRTEASTWAQRHGLLSLEPAQVPATV